MLLQIQILKELSEDEVGLERDTPEIETEVEVVPGKGSVDVVEMKLKDVEKIVLMGPGVIVIDGVLIVEEGTMIEINEETRIVIPVIEREEVVAKAEVEVQTTSVIQLSEIRCKYFPFVAYAF